ncbi:MAG: large-conductance mechanosensitive channel protein MscL [Prevotellaceae bacterium]|nr:large-conductance mechanosensitive channel protein MscL [Candidatus Minthosoma equi]
MAKFIEEFKEFALKGNVMDMAVGVIIGGAFGKIVTSVVGDLIMPPINYALAGASTGSLKWVLRDGVAEVVNEAGDVVTPAVEEIAINYGAFLQNCIDFLIIAIIIFLMIKGITKLTSLRKKKEEEPAAPEPEPEPTKEEILLTEIRDLLKKK